MSATVQSHMQKYSCFYSDVILQFLSDLYTGDFITGKQTEEEAFDFHLVCKSLMKEGGFNLQKRIRVELLWRIMKKITKFLG